jgi:hypothetical protein
MKTPALCQSSRREFPQQLRGQAGQAPLRPPREICCALLGHDIRGLLLFQFDDVRLIVDANGAEFPQKVLTE